MYSLRIIISSFRYVFIFIYLLHLVAEYELPAAGYIGFNMYRITLFRPMTNVLFLFYFYRTPRMNYIQKGVTLLPHRTTETVLTLLNKFVIIYLSTSVEVASQVN